jgi:hypothetical protein
MRKILIAAVIVFVSFAGSLWALQTFWSGSDGGTKPKLVELPPLQPASRMSYIVAPTSVTLAAIRDAIDRAAPRNLSGQSSNPISNILSKADIGWTMGRGNLAVTGHGDALTVTAPLNGTLRVTGQIATQAGNLTGQLGAFLNSGLGKELGGITGKLLDQRAEIHGAAIMTSRPTLTSAWRLEPNLTAQVSMGNSAISVAGIKLNVADQVKPVVDRTVNEQISALQARLRTDPFIEAAARREWTKMCRSVALGGGASGVPALWLELKPTRAFVSQPRIDASNFTINIGVQADTRVIGAATKPVCPFPAQLEIMPPGQPARVGIGVPIDVSFTEISRVLDAQLKGRSFPEDGSSPIAVTILHTAVAASGDQLLISLRVKANEQRSFFGFGAEANVHIWGKPVLDTDKQILRLTDVNLAVESEAAFGLLGAAARAAMPYLQQALAENAVIDLKPFIADARTKIGDAIAEFRQSSDGVRVDAAIDDLRLAGIEFDSKTLRVTAEAAGTAKVAISQLPAL